MLFELLTSSHDFLENDFVVKNLSKTTLKTKNTWFFAYATWKKTFCKTNISKMNHCKTVFAYNVCSSFAALISSGRAVGGHGKVGNIILLTLTSIWLRKNQQTAIRLIKLFQINKIKSSLVNLKSQIFFPLDMIIISMSGNI